jgi:hypothetical protein
MVHGMPTSKNGSSSDNSNGARAERSDPSSAVFSTPEESLKLMEAFARIREPATRAAIISVVSALADQKSGS